MSRKTLLLGLLLIVGYSLALNLPYLWEREFQGEAARRVVASLEMMERQDYVIPYIEGRPYLLKPPLYNWVLISFFKLTGSHSEFVARLSSVAAATLTALFLAFIFREVARPKGLLWVLPGLVFLSIPEVLDKACRAEIDMTYTFLVTISVFSWFYLHEVKNRPGLAWTLALGLAALATLTKTFQAPAFLYGAVGPYLLIKKRLREFFSATHLLGLAAYAVVFALWFVPAAERVGAQAILQAWLGEYLGRKSPLEPSGFWGHFFGFPLEYLQGHLPWILFLPGWADRRLRKELSPGLSKLALFSFCLVAFSFPVYWLLPGTRLRYVLPAVGGLTLLVAIPLHRYLFWGKFSALIQGLLGVLMVAVVLGVTAFLILSWQRLHLAENPFAVVSLLGLIPLAALFFFLRRATSRVILLFLFMWLAKLSFAAAYFPYQARYRSHYVFAARKLQTLLPRSVELCDYRVNTPHITYYLKYKWQWVKEVRLVPEGELRRCRFVLSWRRPPGDNFVKITDIKARRRKWSLWVKKPEVQEPYNKAK
ncbi:ArnT family glycosyltransferase [Thermosulfurimonas dismutans]|uniref:Uncharacterized protein n=1 Tax=Thermosulfurimonas dismutans TaxID=999894 RepID=A0A179D8B9_9BACT|nr:glycosyltransferase family 39 protein [Thermosulfurimonas dismutans]OAQ21828.1 hypothetical protein TDIS_0346 [Thermosulfurimonas dismutans]